MIYQVVIPAGENSVEMKCDEFGFRDVTMSEVLFTDWRNYNKMIVLQSPLFNSFYRESDFIGVMINQKRTEIKATACSIQGFLSFTLAFPDGSPAILNKSCVITVDVSPIV